MSLSDKPLAKSLDKESYYRLTEARRSIWYGGLKGLIYGSLVGFGGSYYLFNRHPHLIFRESKQALKPVIKANYIISTAMVLGSIFSFVGASVEGKNAFAFLSDVFYKNAVATTSYGNIISSNLRENLSSEVFERRRLAIEESKQRRKQDEIEMNRRSY